jgi:hypothetical protein
MQDRASTAASIPHPPTTDSPYRSIRAQWRSFIRSLLTGICFAYTQVVNLSMKLRDIINLTLGPRHERIRRRLAFWRWRANTAFLEWRDGFDRRFGTETSSYVRVGALGVDGAAAEAAESYSPARVPWLWAMLRRLEIDPREFVFVDLGAGKGRALLVASGLPFQRIVGVELSPRLCTVARRNLAIYRSAEQRCFALEVVCGDAGEFPPPAENTVFFMFNPFRPEVLSRVIANVEESLRTRPREVLVLYAWPVHAELFRRPGVSLVFESPAWHLYRMHPPGAAAST